MKAKKVVITGKGGLGVIKIQEYTVVGPGDNEVQIKVAYAGLAYADLMLRKVSMPGLSKPPFTPGADAAGIVDRVGKNVKAVKPGDRVAALMMSDFGGQAQYVNVKADRVHVIPDDVPLEKALCLLINYLTAYRMFMQNVIPDGSGSRKILIHGGSGGVGSALVQIAKAFGNTVVSTASGKNLRFVREMGADVIDYGNEDFVSVIENKYKSVDYVFDPIGGSYLGRSLKILKKGGKYIGYGFQENINEGMTGILSSLLQFMVQKLINLNKKIRSFQLKDGNPKFYQADLQELFQLYVDKKIDPVISEIISLENASKAHEKLEAGDRNGKIIIKA